MSNNASPHRCCSWHLPTSRFASEDGAHDWNNYFALSPGFLFTDIQPSTSVYQQQIPSSSYAPAGPHVPLNELYSHPYRYAACHTDHPTNVPSGSGIVRSRVAYPCVCPYPPNSCPTTHNPQFICIQNQLRLWQQSQNNQHHDRQQDHRNQHHHSQQPQRRNQHHHRSEHGQQHPQQQDQPHQDQQQPRVQEQQQSQLRERQQPRLQEQRQPQFHGQQLMHQRHMQIPRSSYVPVGPRMPLNEIYSPYKYAASHTDHSTNVLSVSGIVYNHAAYPCVCPCHPHSCNTTHNPQFINTQYYLKYLQQNSHHRNQQHHHHSHQQQGRNQHCHHSEHGQQYPGQQQPQIQEHQQHGQTTQNPHHRNQQQHHHSHQQQGRNQHCHHSEHGQQYPGQQQPQLQEHQQHGQTTRVLSSSDRRLQRAIRMLIQGLQRIMSVNQPVPAAENGVDNSQVENIENVEDIRDSVHVQGEETNRSRSVCRHDAEEE